MRRLWFLVLPVIGLMLAGVVFAQDIRLKPVLPVTGRLDIFNNLITPRQFQTFDTRTGTVLFQRDLAGQMPVMDMTQRQIAFIGGFRSISILNLNYGTVYKHNFEAMSGVDRLTPAGWSVDGENLLYLDYDEGRVYHVYLFNTGEKILLPVLKSRQVDAPVTDVALPGIPPDATLYDFRVLRNPVHSAWVAECSKLRRPLNADEGTVEQFVVYDFWNYETGQYLFLSTLLPQIKADDGRFGWSPDGTLFYYPGIGGTMHEKVAHIVKFDPEAQMVTLLKSARIDALFVSFLGIGDMLLTIQPPGKNDIPEEASTTIYSISQIIDGEWHSRALFKIVGDFAALDDLRFTLTADDAERRELGCLFNPSCPDN